MSLETGDTLGPYEIAGVLGKGGMGEVYRARDPRLKRDVAIKVAGAAFTERFQREAEAIAALSHPNICTLFDVGPDYLVMELVEGPTLGDRAGGRPLPVSEVLRLRVARGWKSPGVRPLVSRWWRSAKGAGRNQRRAPLERRRPRALLPRQRRVERHVVRGREPYGRARHAAFALSRPGDGRGRLQQFAELRGVTRRAAGPAVVNAEAALEKPLTVIVNWKARGTSTGP